MWNIELWMISGRPICSENLCLRARKFVSERSVGGSGDSCAAELLLSYIKGEMKRLITV